MIHPIIGLQLSQILVNEFSMKPKQAVEVSNKLITACQRHGLDIIREEWKDQPKRGFSWDDLANQLQAIEETGRTPWNPPELR